MNNLNRRSFIRLSGGTLASALLATSAGGLMAGCGGSGNERPFGIQLYSLRDAMPEDPEGVLRMLAGFGYRYIESYDGPMGIYWGMGPTGFKSLLDELGMKMLASHVNDFNDFERFKRKAEEAAEIGVKYLICPYAQRESLDEYRVLADEFNRAGEIARQAGVKFAYHNHGYSFESLDGVYPQDLLMENTDPALVEYEMDIYWLVAANADPVEWLRRYPGRFTLSHVKDIRYEDGEFESTTLGAGEIEWRSLLAEAEAQGMEHFILEQEDYRGTTPLEGVRDGAVYLRQLDF